jgi:hypothetical protein
MPSHLGEPYHYLPDTPDHKADIPRLDKSGLYNSIHIHLDSYFSQLSLVTVIIGTNITAHTLSQDPCFFRIEGKAMSTNSSPKPIFITVTFRTSMFTSVEKTNLDVFNLGLLQIVLIATVGFTSSHVST